eukprot:GFYU01035355.1.p1 GENE.GFYU01035355.1~~GFYU01035355.1.p1  ORF type:complete len:138 (+),score=6.25 GFYU01035355.1:40-414(+)
MRAVASVCSKLAFQYYGALTHAYPPTVTTSASSSSTTTPLNAELQKGDDNLFPVGEVVRAVGEVITSIPVTQTIQKVTTIPHRIAPSSSSSLPDPEEDALSSSSSSATRLGVVFGRRLSYFYKW